MRKQVEKFAKYGFVILIVGIVGYFTFSIFIGTVDLKKTLQTSYLPSEDPDYQFIDTGYFKVKTPRHWIHLFGGYGDEGHPNGAFLTNKGIVRYEYGMFAPNYFPAGTNMISIAKQDTINRFIIQVGETEEGEVGIHIPAQHEMSYGFSYFMGRACQNNYPELIEGIQTIEFKKIKSEIRTGGNTNQTFHQPADRKADTGGYRLRELLGH